MFLITAAIEHVQAVGVWDFIKFFWSTFEFLLHVEKEAQRVWNQTMLLPDY